MKDKVRKRTIESLAGGGYSNFRFVLEDGVEYAPLPIATSENAAEVMESFRLSTGHEFIPIHANVKEFDFNEEANEAEGSDGITSTFEGMLDAEEIAIRNLVNKYKLNGTPVYVLVDSCKNQRTYMFGSGKCCPAKLKIGYKGGKSISDTKGFPFKVTVESDGLVPIYRGLGSISQEFLVPIDTTSIDVSTGAGTYILQTNIRPNQSLSAINNAVPGLVYTLKWGTSSNGLIIQPNSNFILSKSFTGRKDSILQLRCVKAGQFVEVGRYLTTL